MRVIVNDETSTVPFLNQHGNFYVLGGRQHFYKVAMSVQRTGEGKCSFSTVKNLKLFWPTFIPSYAPTVTNC